VNKSDLVSRLTARLDGDRAKAVAAVNGVLEEIEQSLARGEKVSLFGFGTFDRRERGPRTARNPATGETIQVPASVAPVFRAGAGLRQALAGAAGTARSAAAAVAAVPTAALSVIVPTEPAKKDGGKKASSKKESSKESSKKASTKAASSKVTAAKAASAKAASTKAAEQVSDKAGAKKAKADGGKAAKKSSAKSAKKG
jgi:DNA-binding protein HU-beta